MNLIRTKKVWTKIRTKIEAQKYLKKTRKLMVKSKTKRAAKNKPHQRKISPKKIKRIKKTKIEMSKVILILKVQLQEKGSAQ